MSHERLRERLAEYALDLLPAGDAAAMEAHYAECQLCRIEGRMYFQAREALAVGAAELTAEAPSPEDVDALIAEVRTALAAAPVPDPEPALAADDGAARGRRRFFVFGPRAGAPFPVSPNGTAPTSAAPAVEPAAGPPLVGEGDDVDPPHRPSLVARLFRRGAPAPDDEDDEDDFDEVDEDDDEEEEDRRVAEWWRGAALMILPTALLLAGGLVYVMYQWNETKRDLHAAEVRAEGHPWRFDLITQTNDPAQPAAIAYVAANFRDGMLHASRFPALEQGQHFTVWAEGPAKTQWIAVLRPDPGEREIIADLGPMPEDTERIFVTIELDANGTPTTPVPPEIVSGQRR